VLLGLALGAQFVVAQDVQMVPDQQDREAADKAQSQKDEKDADNQPVTTFRANTNVVQLFFNVKDKKGGMIGNLPKDSFEVSEDGKPQTIKYFSAESQLPLTLGILIDSSASQERVLSMEQEVGGAFLTQILREKDMAFVMDFNIGVSLVQDFTSSARRLKAALNSVKINSGGQAVVSGLPGQGGGPVPTIGQPKGTLLFDAVYLASHDEMGQQVDRKAMILLTDGEDQGSRVKIQDAIEAAQKANSMVYVLLIADRAFYGGGMYNIGYSGDSQMRRLAEATGGRVIDVGNNGKKMEQAFQQIEDELRTQYVASYTPVNAKTDGTYRKVDIQCHQRDEQLKVQARKGYYAIAPED
jgi:VWFA-related protein